MSKTLLAGWEEKTLGEVLRKESSGIAANSLKSHNGKYPIYGASGFVKNIDFFQRDTDYIALIKDGAGVGRIYHYPAKTSVLGTLQYLLPNDNIDIRFAYYFLHSINFSKYYQGAAIPHIYYKDYSKEKIILPPLSEQKRIVEKLDKIFANIDKAKENTKKNLQNAKEVFNSALIEAFIIHNAVESYLKDICIKKQNKNWKDENDNAVYYYIDLSSVDRNTNSIGEVQEIKKSNAPSRAQQIIKKGDILFGTTRPTLKRLCIVPNEFDNHICSTGFCVLRADLKKVIPAFLFYALSHPSFYEYIEPLQRGASYPAVTDKDVLNFKIPLPSLEEQKKIVAQLDALRSKTQELEQIYTKKLADLDELKQSILQQAFSGKL